ncbi:MULTISPECIES: hypothetical protein [unclassified Microbacterium]|uniref:hypothetical protein n=1 Tax=unclassified Microbacterium TaxID=2609290 RepID=UPI00364F1FE2
MTVVPVAYDIPDSILAGLMSGEYMRFGSVVRDSTKIITHLKEVPLPMPDQTPDAMQAMAALKNPKVLIGLGIVVLAAAGGIAVWSAKKGKPKEQPAVPAPVAAYNEALTAYLESIQTGDLDGETIDRLITALEDVRSAADGGSLTIEFSPEQAEALVHVVADYTRKLAEANKVEAAGPNDVAAPIEGDLIVDLRERLRIQRKIFDAAA